MLILTEAQIAQLLTPSDALAAVEGALRAQAEQQAVFPLRRAVRVPKGLLGAMPGAIASGSPALGAKLVTFFFGNAELGRHTHQAIIALFDVETGAPLALMDGRLITEIRTAAASAAATRALAGETRRTLAVLGSGVQARAHVRAHAEVMKLDDVRLWSRNRLNAERLARELRDAGIPVRVADTTAQACEQADVICTTTAAHEPILSRDQVRTGVHINAVGASTPQMREVAADLMAAASIFVDSVDGALNEAGDILMAIGEGALPAAPRLTLLADAIAGRTVGRTTDEEITLFESLGIAPWDLACAALVHDRAVARGLGTEVEL